MQVRIYQQPKTAMQSGRARTDKWVLEFEPQDRRELEPLMGWTASREVLFYLDPPYFAGESDYGKGLFARPDFARVAELLAGLKGRFLLSINDVPETRRIFAAFHLEEVTTTYTIGAGDRAAARAELIVSDRSPVEEGTRLL